FLADASSARLLNVNSLVTCQPAVAKFPISAPTYLCPVRSGTYGVMSSESTRGGTTPVPSGAAASVPNGVIARISSRLFGVMQLAPGVSMQLSSTRNRCAVRSQGSPQGFQPPGVAFVLPHLSVHPCAPGLHRRDSSVYVSVTFVQIPSGKSTGTIS